jgi:phosphatidylserine/phosphatidylglycerophosphate/cardiolipin synthase-like enzyme
VKADELLFHVDRGLGEAVSGAVRAHHRRRLNRIGWQHALDAPPGGWAAGDPPPRGGHEVEILVDGAAALPEIARELEQAQSHVHLTAWFVSPDFALTRDGGQPTFLRNLLAELAERVDVRLLVWAGAPVPLFHPSRRTVRQACERLTRGTRIRCVTDSRERPMHCHHEKTVLVDDRVAFVGGIDLTYETGDRYDTSDHPARGNVGWHDACARIRGPAVADVAEHFRLRWREVSGESLAPPLPQEPSGDVEVQVVRTIPEKVYDAIPRGDFRILESYVRALRSAERLVYLENQFLWSSEIVEILRDKLERPPSDEFRLLVVLPSRPNDGADDTRGAVAELIEADRGAGRFLACTLYARRGRVVDRVYVHAKLGIVDDAWLTLGSANLNEHSLFNDTEMNIVTRDAGLARDTRLRLWAEHLELPVEEVAGDATRVIDERFKPVASEQLERLRADAPLTHRLVELPAVLRRARRLLGPLQGLLVDG